MQIVNASSITIDTCFDSPLYFEDRKYMFLAPFSPVKHYHLKAIKKWKIEVFFTDGRKVSINEENIEEI